MKKENILLQSKIIEKNVKTLVLSDLHLTNIFDERRYNYLKELISKYDNIIINGDFWSAYSITFNEFIESEWTKLFNLLKEKNTTYLYGNHDREEWGGEYVNKFSNKQSHKEILEIGNKKYIIEHGNKIFPRQSIQNSKFLKLNRLLKIDKIIRHTFERFIIKNFGIDTYNKFTKHLSKKIIEYTKNNIKENEILIIGHTHRPEVRLEHKYISSGIIGHGAAQYIVIENEEIKLIKETY